MISRADVATHRQAGQREALERRGGENVGGDAVHRLRAGVICNPAVGDLAEPLDLDLPQQGIAEQPGDEDEGSAGHRC